jgi:peptidoglycan/LPS O-acetylase OafA/YrhL
LIAVGYGFIVIGAISPNSFLFKWNSKATTLIATLSYAIYLTHKGIIHMTHQLLAGYKIESNLMLIICIMTCIIGAYLLNWSVEKPFMKLRNKFIIAKNRNNL